MPVTRAASSAWPALDWIALAKRNGLAKLAVSSRDRPATDAGVLAFRIK